MCVCACVFACVCACVRAAYRRLCNLTSRQYCAVGACELAGMALQSRSTEVQEAHRPRTHADVWRRKAPKGFHSRTGKENAATPCCFSFSAHEFGLKRRSAFFSPPSPTPLLPPVPFFSLPSRYRFCMLCNTNCANLHLPVAFMSVFVTVSESFRQERQLFNTEVCFPFVVFGFFSPSRWFRLVFFLTGRRVEETLQEFKKMHIFRITVCGKGVAP